MITFLIPILARWGVPSRFLRLTAWAVIALIIIALIWLAVALFRGWVHSGQQEAVREDRAQSEAVAREIEAEANRRATAQKHLEELAAERAKAEQMEAINESMHSPDGDPLSAAFNRMR